jgi:hypothetical protein
VGQYWISLVIIVSNYPLVSSRSLNFPKPLQPLEYSTRFWAHTLVYLSLDLTLWVLFFTKGDENARAPKTCGKWKQKKEGGRNLPFGILKHSYTAAAATTLTVACFSRVPCWGPSSNLLEFSSGTVFGTHCLPAIWILNSIIQYGCLAKSLPPSGNRRPIKLSLVLPAALLIAMNVQPQIQSIIFATINWLNEIPQSKRQSPNVCSINSTSGYLWPLDTVKSPGFFKPGSCFFLETFIFFIFYF